VEVFPCLSQGLSGYSRRCRHRPFQCVQPTPPQPPAGVSYGLDEALDLLAALEDGRDVLIDTDHLAVLSQIEHQVQILSRKLGFDEGGSDVR